MQRVIVFDNPISCLYPETSTKNQEDKGSAVVMITSCEQYHEASSYDRHAMGGHFLDWANQPSVFKEYPGLEPLEMPKGLSLPKMPMSSILGGRVPQRGSVSGLEGVSRILVLTNTLTAKARYGGEDFYYRSAASAGALYPTEVYVAVYDIKGVPDGLYHYGIHRHSLHPLRQGDFMARVREMVHLQGPSPRLVFFLTAIFFRSAWKYRSRAYRYHLLDTGHVLENLLLAFAAEGIPGRATYDFDDQTVNRFLGLDERREGALAVAQVVGTENSSAREETGIPELPEDIRGASKVSGREVEYPAIGEIHEAGSRVVKGASPEAPMYRVLGLGPASWSKVQDLSVWPETLEYPDALFQRRSKRNFVERPIGADQMGALLNGLCASLDGEQCALSNDYIATGFLVGRVEGMAEGFYLLDPAKGEMGLVSKGAFTQGMARICLDQMWLANAGAHFLFMANLQSLSRTWGPRGYRYAMLTAGCLGQKLYLVATAVGLGCCGIGAFYDGEARGLLGLNESSRLLYLVAVGSVKKL